jgi:hypothetical protein
MAERHDRLSPPAVDPFGLGVQRGLGEFKCCKGVLHNLTWHAFTELRGGLDYVPRIIIAGADGRSH